MNLTREIKKKIKNHIKVFEEVFKFIKKYFWDVSSQSQTTDFWNYFCLQKIYKDDSLINSVFSCAQVYKILRIENSLQKV